MKTKIALSTLAVLVTLMVAISCKKNENQLEGTSSSTPELPSTPYNYRASQNDHLASLGRVLFYDKNLSLNNSVSCGSCHQQNRAFTDNQQFSTGLENVKTPRNTPSLFARSSRMFWDGRAGSMSDLVLRPIQNHVEMRFENLKQMAEKVAAISYYRPLFDKAFSAGAKIDSLRIQQALTEFLNNFNFSNNKFSKSREGGAQLTASEKLGELIFLNKGQCSNCHHIENENNIFFPGGDTLNGSGGGYGRTNESHNIGLDMVYADNGVGAVSKNSFENGSFMIPVLLNVEFTAPYMHDGRFKTLEDVVEHYNSGIKNHPNLDFRLRSVDFENMSDEEILTRLDVNHDGQVDQAEMGNIPPMRLGLTQAEKKGLVDFLKTLSDPSILIEQKFSNPFTMK